MDRRAPRFLRHPSLARPRHPAGPSARQGRPRSGRPGRTARLTPDDIYANARADLEALSDSLGEKPFFLGENPVSLDASAYGLLAQVLFVPVETRLKADLKSFGNLTAYCERIRNSYFAG